MKSLLVEEFLQLSLAGYLVVDAREAAVLCDGFIRNSIAISADESFIEVFQELVEDMQQVLLLCSEQDITQLLRGIGDAGINNIYGYYAAGNEGIQLPGKSADLLICIDAEEFALDYKFEEFFLIDCRSEDEFDLEHVEGATHIAISDIGLMTADMDSSTSYYIYAGSFAMAVTAGSLLKRSGIELLKIVTDGYEKIKPCGIPIERKTKKGNSNSRFPGK